MDTKPTTAQQRYRERNLASGLCRDCTAPRATRSVSSCEYHLSKQRDRRREKNPNMRMYACGKCREKGHQARCCPLNLQTCPSVHAAAAPGTHPALTRAGKPS